MKSPFPGMDPYLESHWRDIHARLVTYCADALQPRLPAGLRARMEERVYVHSPLEQRDREIMPDVRVLELPGAAPSAATLADASIGVAVTPVIVPLDKEDLVETYIEIREVEGELVTVIEFLSPTNKLPGNGQRAYQRKQQEVIAAGSVNLVEIDLTRQGRRQLIVPLDRIKPAQRTTYQVCVFRAAQFIGEVYPVSLRHPLPDINVPLRADDPDLTLELQPLIEQAYRNGGYDTIDYAKPCDPPLPEGDAAWAATLTA